MTFFSLTAFSFFSSDRFEQCCISFLVQPGRSAGNDMCLRAPGIYSKDNNNHVNNSRDCTNSFQNLPMAKRL